MKLKEQTLLVIYKTLLTTVNYAYWDVEQPPTLTAEHADNLSATLTPDKLESGKAAAINSVLATYEGISVLQSWTIQLSSIMPSLSNFINQYRLAKNRPVGRVFENGEQVVLSTTQDYSVVIQELMELLIHWLILQLLRLLLLIKIVLLN